MKMRYLLILLHLLIIVLGFYAAAARNQACMTMPMPEDDIFGGPLLPDDDKDDKVDCEAERKHYQAQKREREKAERQKAKQGELDKNSGNVSHDANTTIYKQINESINAISNDTMTAMNQSKSDYNVNSTDDQSMILNGLRTNDTNGVETNSDTIVVANASESKLSNTSVYRTIDRDTGDGLVNNSITSLNQFDKQDPSNDSRTNEFHRNNSFAKGYEEKGDSGEIMKNQSLPSTPNVDTNMTNMNSDNNRSGIDNGESTKNVYSDNIHKNASNLSSAQELMNSSIHNATTPNQANIDGNVEKDNTNGSVVNVNQDNRMPIIEVNQTIPEKLTSNNDTNRKLNEEEKTSNNNESRQSIYPDAYHDDGLSKNVSEDSDRTPINGINVMNGSNTDQSLQKEKDTKSEASLDMKPSVNETNVTNCDEYGAYSTNNQTENRIYCNRNSDRNRDLISDAYIQGIINQLKRWISLGYLGNGKNSSITEKGLFKAIHDWAKDPNWPFSSNHPRNGSDNDYGLIDRVNNWIKTHAWPTRIDSTQSTASHADTPIDRAIDHENKTNHHLDDGNDVRMGRENAQAPDSHSAQNYDKKQNEIRNDDKNNHIDSAPNSTRLVVVNPVNKRDTIVGHHYELDHIDDNKEELASMLTQADYPLSRVICQALSMGITRLWQLPYDVKCVRAAGFNDANIQHNSPSAQQSPVNIEVALIKLDSHDGLDSQVRSIDLFKAYDSRTTKCVGESIASVKCSGIITQPQCTTKYVDKEQITQVMGILPSVGCIQAEIGGESALYIRSLPMDGRAIISGYHSKLSLYHTVSSMNSNQCEGLVGHLICVSASGPVAVLESTSALPQTHRFATDSGDGKLSAKFGKQRIEGQNLQSNVFYPATRS